MPAELIESELFGHEKGSFTGASGRHIGKFEQADQGTIFLDEIGDMPLNMQAKLLRVLEEGEVERIGGDKAIPINVRVVVATHRDLEARVREETFRQDRKTDGNRSHSARTRSQRCNRILGQGTFANCATWSSVSCCLPRTGT